MQRGRRKRWKFWQMNKYLKRNESEGNFLFSFISYKYFFEENKIFTILGRNAIHILKTFPQRKIYMCALVMFATIVRFIVLFICLADRMTIHVYLPNGFFILKFNKSGRLNESKYSLLLNWFENKLLTIVTKKFT